MTLDERDLEKLRAGQPPDDRKLLTDMTVGQEVWLDRFSEHYLENFIAQGGSKVKVLVGGEGAGKTHLLRCVGLKAHDLGYAVVQVSARGIEKRLNDLPGFYRAIARNIDAERLARGLCTRVAAGLGYDADAYDGADQLLRRMIEEERLLSSDAQRVIRKAVAESLREVDVMPSFHTFAFTAALSRLCQGRNETEAVAVKWLRGEPLDRHERRSVSLYEKLHKANARYWLNSLIHLLTHAGMKGLAVLVDDLEVITERSPETRRFLYTPNAIKDTCELFRQIIDDAELLNRFVLVLAGRRSIIEDERRGFQSYAALWMRLQTGLQRSERFNPFADLVDVDMHARAIGEGLAQRLTDRLTDVFRSRGYKRAYRPDVSGERKGHVLRSTVAENAAMAERDEG